MPLAATRPGQTLTLPSAAIDPRWMLPAKADLSAPFPYRADVRIRRDALPEDCVDCCGGGREFSDAPPYGYTGAICSKCDGSGHVGCVRIGTLSVGDVAMNMHGSVVRVKSHDGIVYTETLSGLICDFCVSRCPVVVIKRRKS